MKFTKAPFRRVLASAAGVIAGFTVSLPVTVGAHDMLPIISLLTPTQNQTVGGYVSFYVTSDSAGIVGLRFQIDGQDLGSEIVSGACRAGWDSTQTNDGLHTIQAVGRDQFGNLTLAQPVTVLVSNPVFVPPPAPNPTPTPIPTETPTTTESPITTETSTPDPTTPAVIITAPLAGTSVSGIVPITANFPTGTLFLSYVLRDPVTGVTRWTMRGPDLAQSRTSATFLADMSAVPVGAYDLLVVSQRQLSDVISARVSVKVTALAPAMTMTLTTAVVDRTFTGAAILKRGTVAVAGATVSFVVTTPKGTRWTYSGKTNSQGIALIQGTLDPRGTYRMTASASADAVTVTASGSFIY